MVNGTRHQVALERRLFKAGAFVSLGFRGLQNFSHHFDGPDFHPTRKSGCADEDSAQVCIRGPAAGMQMNPKKL